MLHIDNSNVTSALLDFQGFLYKSTRVKHKTGFGKKRGNKNQVVQQC